MKGRPPNLKCCLPLSTKIVKEIGGDVCVRVYVCARASAYLCTKKRSDIGRHKTGFNWIGNILFLKTKKKN